jgi:uncharacterized protein YabN with tetrapyrrole methylase and pyrophosphatase domain
MMSFHDYEDCVIDWAEARKILPNSTAVAQCLKAVSEMGELADAVNKKDRDAMQDAVGDVIVCLINLCALEDTDVTTCLGLAWDQIKDRKGTLLPSGVFVKEEK